MSETDTPASAGTESAPLIENDTPQTSQSFDPFEDTEEEEIIGGTEDETEEAEPEAPAEDEASGEEPAAEEPAAEETKPTKEASDDVVVALPDGSKVELAELKKGYLRQADYSRKTVELANTRQSVVEQAERISRITEAFVDTLAARLPAKPDPALMYQDFQAYQLQKAIYDESLADMERFIQFADQPKAITKGVAEQDRSAHRAEQLRMLHEAVPETKDPKGWEKFQQTVMSTGRKAGLTDDEMAKIDDHRMLVLAHWAAKGMEAAEASKVAKAKVVAKPPVASPPRRSAKPAPSQDYVKHIRRASETGSLDDVTAAYVARKRG